MVTKIGFKGDLDVGTSDLDERWVTTEPNVILYSNIYEFDEGEFIYSLVYTNAHTLECYNDTDDLESIYSEDVDDW